MSGSALMSAYPSRPSLVYSHKVRSSVAGGRNTRSMVGVEECGSEALGSDAGARV